MKKNCYSLITALAVAFFAFSCSDSDNDPETPKPPTPNPPPTEEGDPRNKEGWTYYDGDEFDNATPSPTHWGIYGDPKVGNSKYGQSDHHMLQTYRPSQLSMRTLPTGEKVCRIHAVKDGTAPIPSDVKDKTGWWSGALSSRDASKNNGVSDAKYYPLFCRIEIKAKIPYTYGVWIALWSRHYLGATQAAELDIEEFFVRQWGDKPFPAKVSQALHLWNTEKNKTDYNVENNRHLEIGDDKPGDNFHVYGVQIEPDPRDKKNHAIVTFFLDDKVNYKFETYPHGNKYNRFVRQAFADKREMSTWDIAITGQIGGKEEPLKVGYPANNLNEFTADIDWVRVFVPAK